MKKKKNHLEYLQTILKNDPNNPKLHYALANAYKENEQWLSAMEHYKIAVHYNPHHLHARFYLATLYLHYNALDAAEIHFEQLLADHPEHVQSLVNMGVILLKKEQGQEAIRYFTQALALDANNIEAQNNLAATFMHYDRFENALTYYAMLLEHDPLCIEYLYNSAFAHMSLGHLDKAISELKTILQQDPLHIAALNNLAAIHIKKGQYADATTLLEEIIRIKPDEKISRFMLDAITGRNPNPGTCPDYIKHLFDNYALYYEQHMTQHLHYTLPHEIVRLLRKIPSLNATRTLDLGCGTGLSGLALREISDYLCGVDISPKMLARAKEKDCYDALIEKDIIAFLNENSAQYNLIVAADVLPYIGDLSTLFTALTPRLTSDGTFVFSTEIGLSKPWELQKSARFCHHPGYIKELCAMHGLDITSQHTIKARKHGDEDMLVNIYTLKPIGN